MPMKKFCLWCGLLLFGAAGGLFGTESYSSLMDKAEKMTLKRYDPKSRAFKIKSRELDDILESSEPREKKIQRLKDFIREMEGDQKGREPDDPLRKLKADAEKGDPESLYQLGVIYWTGRQQQIRSYTRALQCFTRAAAADHRKSQFMLVLADWQGKGVIPDPGKAFPGFEKLYRAGFLPAGIPLGIMCYEGTGTAKNYVTAEKYLLAGLPHKKDIPVGFDPEAVLGRIYYYGGYGVKADPGKAVHYLKASERDAESMFLLGSIYRAGKGGTENNAEAAVCFKAAAEKGNLNAGLELGRMYYFGQGVKKDDRLAVQYLRPVVDHGHPDGAAALLLAGIYADPKSPVHDDTDAFYYYRQAARKGNAEGCYRCGMMLLNGTGTGKDPAGAMEYLKAAAKAGNAAAAWQCGELEFGAKRVKESIPYYRQAADQDQVEAIRKFAGLALNGQGMKADPELAIRYLKKLGGRAEVYDLELLASLYESGIGPVKAQISEAIRYYTLAADRKSSKAQVRLARIYLSLGETNQALHYAEQAAGAKDPEAIRMLAELRKKDSDPVRQDESLRYLRDLADRGDRQSMRQLGIMLYGKSDYDGAEKYLKAFENGNDTELLFILGQIAYGKEDFKRALPLLNKAAEAGDPKALVLLGRMYHRGKGVHQDFRHALIFYRQAAAKNDVDGMFLTGSMYYNAEGVSVDYSEALRWFLAAADKGHVLAMQYLSIMYKEGIGVPKNNREAIKWRRKSAGSRP
ncbi:MAG: sel1 repeat family protein [Lentisphaerae bacterium]|nr:sel1 repeat family protein [Lentisphaerota bacterium]